MRREGAEEKGAAQSPHPTPQRSFDSPGRTPRVRKRPEAAAVVSPSPCPSSHLSSGPRSILEILTIFPAEMFRIFDKISIGSIDGNGSATGRSRALLEGGGGGGLAEGLRNNRVAGALLKSDGRATEATGARYERMAARTGKASGRSALGGVMFLLVSVAVFAPAADAFKERDVIDSVMATIRNRAANQGHEQPNTLDELAGAPFGYIPSDDASSRPRLTPLIARSRTLYLSRARANRDAQSSDPTCSRPSGLSSRRTEPRTSSPRSSS